MNTTAEEITKSTVPALDQDNMANWLEEDLTGYLMGRKRAHLALTSERPKIIDAELEPVLILVIVLMDLLVSPC